MPRRLKQPAKSSAKPKRGPGRPPGLTKRDDRMDDFTGVAATMSAIKRHLDLTLHEFNDLVDLQLFPTGITLDAARIRYVRYLRAVARGEELDASSGKVEAKNERSRLAAAQREKIEMNLSVQRGELVRAADVSRALSGAFATTRTRLLGLPTKLAHEMSVLKRATEIEALLKKALREILDELADAAMVDGESEGDRRRRGDDAAPATRSHRQRVG